MKPQSCCSLSVEICCASAGAEVLCSASVLTGANAVPIACAKSQELVAKMQARAKPGTTVSSNLDALNFSFGFSLLWYMLLSSGGVIWMGLSSQL